MNGAATRKGAPPPLHALGRSMTEGFNKPRYTPVNPADRPRISAMVDLDDPIQIHLLMETALSDSKQWEILSQEEVDDLKKQTHSLTIRIDQARANLAIQTKYRDAAVSMARLYNPGHRRHSSREDMAAAREAEVEKQNSERLCNELSSELAMLENHLFDSQRRLLQHTAAILQLTHGARRRNAQTPNGQVFGNSMMVNGMPESPESLYTYTNSRDSISMEPIGGDDGFDWRTLHPSEGGAERSVTPAPTAAPTLTNLEIPPKSPIREQTSQLREEMERVKEENERLKAAEQKLRDTENQLRAGQQELSAENDAIRTEINGQIRLFAETEQRLEILNHKLRDVITEINPSADANLDDPEPSAGNGQTLPVQLNYLERGLDMAMHEQQLRSAAINRDLELAGDASAATLSQAEKRIEALNRRAHGFLAQTVPDTPAPPTISEGSLDEQLDYLETTLRTIRVEMGRAQGSTANANNNASRSNSEQVEAVLMGLWDIIHTGYAEIQRAKAARRQKRIEMNLSVDDEDEDYLSGNDEAIDPNEQYSLQGFSAKVQWLYAQATSLKEQKAVLQRQIKQQRELNNKTGSEKDAELREKMEELEKMRGLIDDAEARVHEAKDKMESALEQMETMQRTTAEREEAAMARGAQQTQDKLMERNAVIANLESKFNDVSTRLAETEADVVDLQSQLEQSAKAKAAAEKSQKDAEDVLEGLRKEMKDKDEELERMNMMLVEIKMEMTIAKAELDGAYGSRAERAAQAAAISNKSELADLQAQVAKLKMELESTLKDFEAITKESIAAEKEKLDLEHKLDDALQAKESLESEVAELREKMDREIGRLKEELDKERLRPPPSPALSAAGSAAGGLLSPRMGAAMLSEQFRATMKEERKRFNEEMKEELAKRRKLEEELRALRRTTAATAGGGLSPGLKSPLSTGALSPRS
ncbi:Up-regulated during septation-domain-containing protein [Copromyces sp. CBS 386.78]|nr:Up-regulated during septation-domain-containing protein [Copromyces sp. CBS 386.78]